MDPLTRLRAGIGQARPIIAAVDPADYGEPTPCPDWTVRELINHMLGALTMFRDVAVDGQADPALFTRDLVGADAAAAFDRVAEQALTAWTRVGLDRTARLPFGEFPATFALQLPAMDVVVHGWDLATATGQSVAWDDELVAETITFSEATFTTAEFRGTDFAPPVDPPPDATPIERLVAYLGRNPRHTPQQQGADTMSAQNEAVVRRFYEEMNNGRKNELAAELFTADHRLHDPQVPAGVGPDAVAAVVKVYQDGVNGHWRIEDIFSSGDNVVVRWTGSGTHVGEVNGIPPTGRDIRVDAISVHRLQDGKIAETWEVWDTLSFLQQIGVVATN